MASFITSLFENLKIKSLSLIKRAKKLIKRIFSKIVKINISYLSIILLLILTGILCYFIEISKLSPYDKWFSDQKFREVVVAYLITTCASIYGINYFIDYQRNIIIDQTLRILGFGYSVHELLAITLNFMSKCEIIQYDEINSVFHNYYQTKRDSKIGNRRINKDDGNERFINGVRQHINFIENCSPNIELINKSVIDIELANQQLKVYEQIKSNIMSKFDSSLKVDSKKGKFIITSIHTVENNIWALSRFVDKQNEHTKKRVFISNYRLLYSLLPLLKNKTLFFSSEIEYDEILIGKYHRNLELIFNSMP